MSQKRLGPLLARTLSVQAVVSVLVLGVVIAISKALMIPAVSGCIFSVLLVLATAVISLIGSPGVRRAQVVLMLVELLKLLSVTALFAGAYVVLPAAGAVAFCSAFLVVYVAGHLGMLWHQMHSPDMGIQGESGRL